MSAHFEDVRDLHLPASVVTARWQEVQSCFASAPWTTRPWVSGEWQPRQRSPPAGWAAPGCAAGAGLSWVPGGGGGSGTCTRFVPGGGGGRGTSAAAATAGAPPQSASTATSAIELSG